MSCAVKRRKGKTTDGCEDGEALSSVHPPAPATGKLIHNPLCDCRVKNDRDTLLREEEAKPFPRLKKKAID